MTSIRHIVSAAALAGSLLPATLWAQMTPRVPELDSEEVASLDAGEILVEAGASGSIVTGYVIGVVDSPLDEVWSVVRDFEGQSDWIPDMYGSRVVERNGNIVVGEGATSVPFPLTDRRWQIRIRHSEDVVDGVETRVATWEDVPDYGNMNDNDGYWLLQPFQGSADRTLVAYRVRVDAGISVPDGIERSVQRRLYPGFIRGLRDRMARR